MKKLISMTDFVLEINMNIKKIKVKPWIEYGSGGGSMCIGKKIVVYTHERDELSINEIEKIKEFFKTLRA